MYERIKAGPICKKWSKKGHMCKRRSKTGVFAALLEDLIKGRIHNLLINKMSFVLP